MGETKTNAMRILDAAGIRYTALSYDAGDGRIDGISVAHKIAMPVGLVYKTLLTLSPDGGVFVCIIPVDLELDLKLCAKAFGIKSLDMLPVKNILAVTGYVRGGCSPIGMKKLYPTRIDSRAQNLQTIVVSAGRIGSQIALDPKDLVRLTQGGFAALCR
jgi:Cys-tRNA(Pro)/Cys-tRNA(Cys) deacylase